MKRKVLIFTPGGVGGAERMCITIGQLLNKDNYEVQYVVWGRIKRIFSIIPPGSDVDVIPFRKVYCFSTIRVWWKIVKSKPDIVFSSSSIFNPRVIIAAKFAGRKTIIRSSGMVGDYGWWKFIKLKITYPFVDLLIAQQEDMRQEMSQMLNISLSKIVTICNPIATDDIERKKNEASPFQNKRSVNYVNVARINWNKGQDVAIKAFSIIERELRDAHLWLVGSYNASDTYYNQLKALVDEKQLADKVHFVGHDENPFKWVKNCDCFVFPSRHEGLPNALVEASYLGVPCAASDCLSIVKDIIKDDYNGYVFKVDDIEGLVEAMRKAVLLKNCQMVYRPGSADDINKAFDIVCKK